MTTFRPKFGATLPPFSPTAPRSSGKRDGIDGQPAGLAPLPIVKAIFSSSDNTIDFRSIIAKRGVLLVNLRKTDYFSADQRNAIGGLLIHEIFSTAETTAREERAPYYLIVDEARLFIGQDLMEGLDQCASSNSLSVWPASI